MLTCICIFDLSAFGEAERPSIETSLVPELEAGEACMAHCTTVSGCGVHTAEKRLSLDGTFVLAW